MLTRFILDNLHHDYKKEGYQKQNWIATISFMPKKMSLRHSEQWDIAGTPSTR